MIEISLGLWFIVIYIFSKELGNKYKRLQEFSTAFKKYSDIFDDSYDGTLVFVMSIIIRTCIWYIFLTNVPLFVMLIWLTLRIYTRTYGLANAPDPIILIFISITELVLYLRISWRPLILLSPLIILGLHFIMFICREYINRNRRQNPVPDLIKYSYKETPPPDNQCRYCHCEYSDHTPFYYKMECDHHAHCECLESWWKFSQSKICIYPFCHNRNI